MKKLIFFLVLIPLLLLLLSQKIYSQGDCSVDLQVINECGFVSLSVVGCSTCVLSWNTGDTSRTIYPAQSGYYFVNVFGQSGCQTQLDYYLILSEPCDTVPVDTLCCNNCDVSVDITYGCGNATIRILDSLDYDCIRLYEWSTGATTQSITVTTSGYYKYRILSNNCDSGWKTVWVQIKPEPTVWISGKDKVCHGFTTILTAYSSGATSSYKWNTGATTQSINAGAGPFKVTVTDVNGCTATATKTITEYSSPTVTITGNLKICSGGNTTLTANTTSCNSCYIWSTGHTTKSILVGSPGTYTVSVTDPVSCCVGTATVVVSTIYVEPPTIYADTIDGGILLTSSSGQNTKWSTGEIGPSVFFGTVIFVNVTAQTIGENGCLSESSCPVSVFIRECPNTGGITIDTVICDTMIIRDTITVRDTLYYEDLIGGCFHGGLVSNPKIQDGSTIGVINNQIVELYAPSNAEALYIDSYGKKIFLWNEVPSTSKVIEIETLREGTYFYRLKCKIQGKEVCLEFGYTIKKGATTPTSELETRDEPLVYPTMTHGELNIGGLPPGIYFIDIINANGQRVKIQKIIMQ